MQLAFFITVYGRALSALLSALLNVLLNALLNALCCFAGEYRTCRQTP